VILPLAKCCLSAFLICGAHMSTTKNIFLKQEFQIIIEIPAFYVLYQSFGERIRRIPLQASDNWPAL